MNRLLNRYRKSLTAIAAAMLIASAVAATGAPAYAAPPDDDCRTYAWHTQQAGNYITAHRWIICPDEPDVPLFVTVDLYTAPNIYVTVASGYGTATYYCNGFPFNRYRTTGAGSFDILCGAPSP